MAASGYCAGSKPRDLFPTPCDHRHFGSVESAVTQDDRDVVLLKLPKMVWWRSARCRHHGYACDPTVDHLQDRVRLTPQIVASLANNHGPVRRAGDFTKTFNQ